MLKIPPLEIPDGEELIRRSTLAFDPGDSANASLYICLLPGGNISVLEDAVERLRAAGLWSVQPHKLIREEQKQTYIEQMRFVTASPIGHESQRLVLARFDHARFASRAERFAAWCREFVSSDTAFSAAQRAG